ncbi:MAG TPA: PAS domain S-box protein, partial [Spirochaetia bacterium]|nr:PAS domain S-box protein [Spirochaetia bacterium]
MLKNAPRYRSSPFPGDERRALRTRITNIVGFLYAGALVVGGAVFVPLFAIHKVESLSIVLGLGILFGVSQWGFRQAELALRRSENRFQMFMEHFPGLAYVKDFDGRIVFANEGFRSLVGVSPEDLPGKTNEEVFGPDFGAKVTADDRRVLESGVAEDIHEVWGGRSWTTYKFVVDQPGDLPLVAGVTVDTSRRQDAEDELARSRELLRAVLDGTSDLIWSVDSDTFGLLNWNRAYEQYVLRSRHLAVKAGMRPADLFPEGSPLIQAWDGYYRKALSEGPFSMEYVLSTGDQILLVGISPMHQQGRPIGISVFGKDITERKRMESALRESEGLFRALFQQAGDSILIIDPSAPNGALIVDANEAACRIQGAERQELVGATVGSIDDPEGQSLSAGRIARAVAGEHMMFETTHVRRDGSTYPVEISAKAVQRSGRPPLIFAIERDISERRRAEESLRRSERTLSQLFHNSGSIFAISTVLEGRFVDVNSRFLEATGYRRDQVVGHTAEELRLFDPAQAARLRDLLKERGSVTGFEGSYRRSSGELGYAFVSATQIEIENAPCILLEAIDITERKAAVEQMELLKASIDSAPDAAYWMDPQSRFVYVNDAGCQAVGYSREELLTMSLRDVNPGATPEAWQEVWRVIKEQGTFRGRGEHRRRDGTLYPVEITSTYFRLGEREYCNGYAQDLTERLRAEAERAALQTQLSQAQRMEAVGRLAGGVAHDFNNMLGVILGHADSALTDLAAGQTFHEEFSEIRKAAQRSADL